MNWGKSNCWRNTWMRNSKILVRQREWRTVRPLWIKGTSRMSEPLELTASPTYGPAHPFIRMEWLCSSANLLPLKKVYRLKFTCSSMTQDGFSTKESREISSITCSLRSQPSILEPFNSPATRACQTSILHHPETCRSAFVFNKLQSEVLIR